MQRATAHYLPREMAILGVLDFALCFILIDTMLQAAGVSVALPPLVDMLPRSDLALAAVLTLIVGGIALPAGLYRPEICRRCQPLLIGIGLVAILAFGVLLLLRDGPDGLIADVRSLYMAEVLTGWLAAMALIRLLHGRLAGRTAATRRVLLFGSPRQVRAVTTRLRRRPRPPVRSRATAEPGNIVGDAAPAAPLGYRDGLGTNRSGGRGAARLQVPRHPRAQRRRIPGTLSTAGSIWTIDRARPAGQPRHCCQPDLSRGEAAVRSDHRRSPCWCCCCR